MHRTIRQQTASRYIASLKPGKPSWEKLGKSTMPLAYMMLRTVYKRAIFSFLYLVHFSVRYMSLLETVVLCGSGMCPFWLSYPGSTIVILWSAWIILRVGGNLNNHIIVYYCQLQSCNVISNDHVVILLLISLSSITRVRVFCYSFCEQSSVLLFANRIFATIGQIVQ